MDKIKQGKVFVQGLLKEELNAVKSDGGGAARIFLDVFDVKEVMSKLILRDQDRRFTKVFRELPHGANVAVLRTFREAPELKSLNHLLTQFRHAIPPGYWKVEKHRKYRMRAAERMRWIRGGMCEGCAERIVQLCVLPEA